MSDLIRNTLVYKLHLVSDRIHSIKAQAASENADGKSAFACMSPKHPGWSEYQQAKLQASLLLTAIKMLKRSGRIPERKDFRKLLRDADYIKSMKAHASKEASKRKDTLHAFLFDAYKLLNETAAQARSDKDLAEKATAHAKAREAAAAQRKLVHAEAE